MAKKLFFNIVSGAHEGSRSVVFSIRTLTGAKNGLTVGSLVAPASNGKYSMITAETAASAARVAEFVFETDDTQSSGTVTTVWGNGEFETNVYEGSPEFGEFLTVGNGKLKVASTGNWLVTSRIGDVIRFRPA